MEGAFAQNHDDSQTFMKGHPNVQLEPFPGFTQITRKDCLWRNFHAMQLKFGRQHFDFLEECLMMPLQRSQLVQALVENPKQWWIVKPPGRNNGSGIYLINFEFELREGYLEEGRKTFDNEGNVIASVCGLREVMLRGLALHNLQQRVEDTFP